MCSGVAVLTPLIGARIERVDLPRPDLLCIGVGNMRELQAVMGRQKATLVVNLATPGIGLCDDRPRGAAANAWTQRLRRVLNASRIVSALVVDEMLVFQLRRGDLHCELRLLWGAREGNAIVVVHAPGDNRENVGSAAPKSTFSYRRDPKAGKRLPELSDDFAGLFALGEKVVDGQLAGDFEIARATLARSIRATKKRVTRRAKAIGADLERTQQAELIRSNAQLLTSNLHRVGPRDKSIVVQDWSNVDEAGQPASVLIEIDRRIGAAEQAQRMFHRAKRLERGREMASKRLADAERELVALDDALSACADADSRAKLEQLRTEFENRFGRGPGHQQRTSTAGGKQVRRPYREYTAKSGHRILVGRSARDNDELTLRVARPHDLWLHARNATGSHVIVVLNRNEQCPPETLVEAAQLAARHSQFANDDHVEVMYTPRRYVRKPKGAAAGSVTPQKSKTILVGTGTPDPTT